MSRLTEEALIQRKKEFAGEIQSLVVALESVSNEAGSNVTVVAEISAAVEKSRQVLSDLEAAIDSFRDAKATLRPFSDDEADMFRYFGFEPVIPNQFTRAASPLSERSDKETETNVYDRYEVRPSPEGFIVEAVDTAHAHDKAVHGKGNYEALIQSEVETRLATLLTSAEAELQARSDALIRDRLQQLEGVISSGVASQPNHPNPPAQVPYTGATMATQTEDDLVELFGIDSADLLESKINDLVNHRVKMEVEKRSGEADTNIQPVIEERDILKKENLLLRACIEQMEEEVAQNEQDKLSKIGEDMPGALEKLRDLAVELDGFSRNKVSTVQQTGQDRLESLNTLREVVHSSHNRQIHHYKKQLSQTRESYKKEISLLGGQLESVMNEGSDYMGVLQDSSTALQRIVSELSEKKFDYNPPEERNQTGQETLDAYVARTLSAIKCPVPIDCHKVGPNEYFFDRKVSLKLVSDVVYVVRKNGTERLGDYIMKLYAPFIQLLEPNSKAGAAVTPHAQEPTEVEQVPLDASGVKELNKLHTQQQELLHLLRTNGKKREGSRSLSPQQDSGRERTYAGRHSQQTGQNRRSSSNGVSNSQKPPFSQDELDVMSRFFESTDRAGVGLVNKKELLRSIKRNADLAARVSSILLLPHEGALNHIISAIPGGETRELSWDTIVSIFREIKQQQKQQVYSESLSKAPKREVARAFNDHLQARQREIIETANQV